MYRPVLSVPFLNWRFIEMYILLLPMLRSYQCCGCGLRRLKSFMNDLSFSAKALNASQNSRQRLAPSETAAEVFFSSFAQSFGCSTILNFGAGSLVPILQSSISNRKKRISLSVCSFNHSIARRCSSRACLTIQIT